ncbi:MAG: glutathione S-transferase N-terminal domain-containing protein [Emcibacter sp.]|nr:glutathione S-transferase N-terminal domain-containing protein [Emcibacter sp.]
MELFYTLTSPYSRKILLLIDDLDLTDQITLTALNPLLDQTGRLQEANPLGKIPALILDNGDTIYDSPIIAEYLYHLSGATPLTFKKYLIQQKMQSLADGIMDAAVSSQMEKNRDLAQQSPYWQDRWQNAIMRSVVEFEKNMIDDARVWHIGSMSMACALDYLCFRHSTINWMDSAPNTLDWYKMVTKKLIMIKTDPRTLL